MRTITREAYEGDIVSRLRHWRGLHLAHGGELFEEAADEIERLRLTNEERAAILASEGFWALEQSPHAATLRSLLDRLA
jgi:hypothetical protein